MSEAAPVFQVSNQLLQPDVHMHACAEVGSLLQSHFLMSEFSGGKNKPDTCALQMLAANYLLTLLLNMLFFSFHFLFHNGTQLPIPLQLMAFCFLTSFLKLKYKNSSSLISTFLPLVLLWFCCAVPRTASCWKYVSPVECSCVTPSWPLHVQFYFPLCDNVAPTPPCVFPFSFIL